jgi:hypothetical protein
MMHENQLIGQLLFVRLGSVGAVIVVDDVAVINVVDDDPVGDESKWQFARKRSSLKK